MTGAGEGLPEGGPFFEDLRVGMKVTSAPSVTLTDGQAAVHQAIVGDRLRLALDTWLSRAVTGQEGAFAHPALVWDLAIGQSTLLTRRVVANLFYRGLVFRRAPVIGDTLATTTEVVALRQNTPRPGRAATGMAVLRIRTVDQWDRVVLDFWRCAMLPLADPEGRIDQADLFDAIPTELDRDVLASAIRGWRLDRFLMRVRAPSAADLEPGRIWQVQGGDVVSSAPELARLSLNVATAHHDASATGRRLVYGGLSIGIAGSQLCRALPGLVTIVGWCGCDHTGPVLEGDTLTSEVTLERMDRLPQGGALAHLRSIVHAVRADGGERVPVLDWRPVGVLA